MKNKKENIIEALRGSYMFVDNLPELINNETIYDKNGIVDTELMTAILEWVSRISEVTTKVSCALGNLLGIEDEEKIVNKKDEGSKWSVEEILKHCTLEDNVMKLPQVQFNKKSYAEAKKWIEEAGGSWQGGKIQGFTFPFNAERVFSILHEGKRCNLQQEYQYFATPPEVADWLVMLAGGIHEDEKVLEPSAGTGAIIDAIHRSCKDVVVDCFELMPENKELLSKKSDIQILGDDFTVYDLELYDKIIANPPFSKNQDIKHVKRMYEYLKEGGTIAAIMSCHWKIASEKECADFRKWLKDVHAKIYDIEEGSFKQSGTGIETTAVVIQRMGNE